MNKESTPLISVIIPNYNNGKYLLSCIRSINNQTYNNIEIIIIDDCSTDGSLAIISDLADQYDNIKYFINDVNRGVSFTRNFGVRQASGPYITTLDPDDEYYPNKIEAELAIIKQHGDNVIAYSGYSLCDSQLKFVKRMISSSNAVSGDVYLGMLYRAIPFSRDMLMSRQVFINSGGYNSNLSLYEDWDLKLRLAKSHHYYYSGVDGVKYRQNCGGLSSVDFSRHMDGMSKVFLSNSQNSSLEIFKMINGKRIPSRVINKLLRYRIFNQIFLYILSKLGKK